MNSNQPSNPGPSDLTDPNIDPQTLAQIAETSSDLWPAIQSHPNCYPELHRWIAANLGQQQEQPYAPTAQQGSWPAPLPTPEQWAAEFQQQNGREPTMSEFRHAQAQGAVAPERKATDPSMQQMSQGAKQLAEGAKGFFTERVAPTAVGSARTLQNSIGGQVQQARKDSNWQSWIPIALPAFALISIIALMLPAMTASASGFGFSVSDSQSFFGEDMGGMGWWLLIFLLAVLISALVAIAKTTKRARITAGIIGVVVGLITAYVGFAIIAAAGSFSGSSMWISASASAGPGAVILAICSIGLLLAAILTLVIVRGQSKRTPAQRPWSPGDPQNPQNQQ